LAVVTLGTLFGAGAAGGPQSGEKDKAQGLPDLVAALKASPGCIGVESATTESGKEVIFAWFEDKKAAVRWYESDLHQQLIKRLAPNRTRARPPLAGVPDDSGPIMAIASITMDGKPTKERPLPVKQISIELYQPLPGGFSRGGRFAPDALKIPEPRRGAAGQ
jgi:hypothetical protein